MPACCALMSRAHPRPSPFIQCRRLGAGQGGKPQLETRAVFADDPVFNGDRRRRRDPTASSAMPAVKWRAASGEIQLNGVLMRPAAQLFELMQGGDGGFASSSHSRSTDASGRSTRKVAGRST